jgi:hypothetical protein
LEYFNSKQQQQERKKRRRCISKLLHKSPLPLDLLDPISAA